MSSLASECPPKTKVVAMRLKPEELSNEKYDCRIIMETLRGEPVLIMSRKAYSMMNWCIMKDFSTCFFATRRKAVDFCETHGYGIPKPLGVRKSLKSFY